MSSQTENMSRMSHISRQRFCDIIYQDENQDSPIGADNSSGRGLCDRSSAHFTIKVATIPAVVLRTIDEYSFNQR